MECLISFINDAGGLWMLLLVVTLLLCKQYRMGGVIVLMILIFTGGTIPFWILGIIVILTVFTLYLRPYQLFKRKYEKKVNEFYRNAGVKERKTRRLIVQNTEECENNEQE